MTQESSYSDVDDAELLRRHVEGDTAAFGEIVRRHQARLWAVAIRTLGNPDDAADALQDALIKAFRRADSFRAESAVTTWLHRIVVNSCLDHVRHAASRPADPVTFESDPPPARTRTDLPDDPAERTALRLDLESALAALPTEQRVPLVLVDVEGYSVAEVAELLGVPAGTVKSRCARARARLVSLLTPDQRVAPTGNQLGKLDVPPQTAGPAGGDRP